MCYRSIVLMPECGGSKNYSAAREAIISSIR